MCRSLHKTSIILDTMRTGSDWPVMSGTRKLESILTGTPFIKKLKLFVQGMDVTYIAQDVRWPALSDARVPCVPIFCVAGAQAFAELF